MKREMVNEFAPEIDSFRANLFGIMENGECDSRNMVAIKVNI